MALEVLDGGLLTTVQDLGRTGYEQYGVPVAGAMDPFALRAANWLVGNPVEAAALEITLVGPRLRAAEKCLVAVTGADLGLRVNGRDLPPWMAVFVRQGWEIEFRRGAARCAPTGCRAILAVAGGIDVAPVMGSRSTYLSGGFGGFEGRALRRGDVIPVGQDSARPGSSDPGLGRGFGNPLGAEKDLPTQAGRTFPRHLVPPYSDTPTIRVILGPQDDYFTEEGIATFLSSEYEVSPTSDRMGCRLVRIPPSPEGRGQGEGRITQHKPTLSLRERGRSFISDGIPLGAVQVPPDGQPIVMLADRQTTGGYPKIATVISTDIPLLAQCVPGQSRVRFEAVGIEEAQASYRKMMGFWRVAPET